MKQNKRAWASRPWSVVLVLGALMLVCAVAQAQRRGAPKVIELDEEVIEGRQQKPEAFYILQHTSLNYERLDAKESFIPEMVESVKKDPF
jgi:hypothetical protein